ncbi:MAG TPA: DUF2269 family protein [Longimicrobiales bacterium]
MFTLYNLLKFLHVTAVIVWIGGMIALAVVNARLAREREHAALQVLSRQGEFLGKALMGPSALVTLLAGVGLVGVMGGGFAFWMAWGLVGVFGSMAIGALFMQRTGRQLAAVSAAEAPDPTRLARLRRRMSLLGMLNILLLLSTVWAMVFKPTL